MTKIDFSPVHRYDLTMPESEIIVLLNTAQTAEKESLRQYLEFAYQTKDPGGKDMFIRLALDEYHHWQLIERQLLSFNQTGIFKPVDIPTSLLERLVPHLSQKELLIRGKEKQDKLNALQTALQLERSARDFYHQARKQAAADELRQLLLRLEQMEQAHLELIQAEIDHIQKTGFWFWFAEFTLEGNP